MKTNSDAKHYLLEECMTTHYRSLSPHKRPLTCFFRVLLSVGLGLLACALILFASQATQSVSRAEPLPGGIPKLILSTKTVTPTIVAPGPVTLTYNIRLINTGAWTATATSLIDVLPASVTFINGTAQASAGPQPIVQNGILSWTGDVGFDSAVVITFSAALSDSFTFGQVINSAVINDAQLTAPITVTAVTTVTNVPLLTISKSSAPAKPGPNKSLVYRLTVANAGQPAINLPITVTDQVPLNTTVLNVSPGGVAGSGLVTWTRSVTLALNQTTAFTFSVMVGGVSSGTVIANANYQVANSQSGVTAGAPHTVTVVNPIFSLSKSIWPDPPGSNREMTYTLTLLNSGSQATSLVITDRVPTGVNYVRGGALSSGVVSWSLPALDTGESAQFTYTVYINNVMNVPIFNKDYRACSAEGVCQTGKPLTNTVIGPTFMATVKLDPIAKKPGGGGGPVTPTLVVHNLGPGNAINAMAALYFDNISVSANDLYVTPAVGTPPPFPVPLICNVDKCYVWVGPLGVGETITFTTITGQSTIGGAEGTLYTATIVLSDSLSNMSTTPITATAVGEVTHYADPIPVKSAPPVIGRGDLLTYTINIVNYGLSTELPPILTDTIPASTTFVSADYGGVSQTINLSGSLPTAIVSWTLPSLGPGDSVVRSFAVRVNNNLVSGTQIVNNNYLVAGYGNILTGTVVSGPPVTTTVREVGLIDSYKEVTPTITRPGPDNVLTYTLHIVNSSPLPVTGVTAADVLPWQVSTYQRDAVASAGSVVSDIVTLHWTGSVPPYSSQLVTFTVRVDPNYAGPVTNTATINHSGLLTPVVVSAVAYVTDQPVLFISKSAAPDPVKVNAELAYTIRVINAGQQATGLVITDVIPANTSYVPGSATADGQLIGNQIRWEVPVLKPATDSTLEFRVKVNGGKEIVNADYAVQSAEGISTRGAPLVTRVGGNKIYLPLVRRN